MKMSRGGVLPIAFAVVACLYDRAPTEPAEAREPQTVGFGGVVYAEERRAVELASEIKDLAGFFFDTAGNVVVTLTDPDNAEVGRSLLRTKFGNELGRARERNPSADVMVRRATYSFVKLKEWRDRLMAGDILSVPGAVWLDLDEAQNRVVIGLDIGGDAAAIRLVARNLGVPPDAVQFETTGAYIPQQTLQDEFRPIVGGIQIQRLSGSTVATCTLAFTALRNNEPVFLTAGHCSPNATGADAVEQFQPTVPLTAEDSATMTAIGREIVHSSEPCGNRRCSYSDAAIYEIIPDTVPPISSSLFVLGRIQRPDGGCMPGPCDPPRLGPSVYGPFTVDTTQESFVVNDLVNKIGSATGWSAGWVQRTCVNVSPAKGVTLYCQVFADYGAGEGDSGAPILLDIGFDSTATLGGIHSGRAGSNSVFSPWSGIVQDYGMLSVVPAEQDTARPPVPPLPNLPSDSTFTVESPGYPRSQLLHYRNIVRIAFDDSTSGTTIRNLFKRYSATVIGGIAGPVEPEYILQVPDPGPTFEALDSLLNQLNQEPGVTWAASVYYRTPGSIYRRYPNDGPGARHRDWSSATPTDTTRSLRAIRAPLAWGCETGAYEQTRVGVGVVDYVFDVNHLDLAGTLVPPPDPGAPQPSAPVLSDVGYRSHGTGVASVLAAIGNNGIGITGMLWRSNLTMYSYSRGPWVYPDLGMLLKEYLADAVAHGVRLLVFSHALGDVANERHVAILRAPLEAYLQSGGLLVMATGQTPGQPGLTLTVEQLAQTSNTRLHALHRAVAQLYNGGYSDNILFVGGADDGGRFWASSNYWSSATILAPATNIVTLANTADFPAGTWTVDGTSWSAPYVAGVAGLLWANDPTLTAAQVKDFILRGAQLPRWNPQTQQIEPPQAVGGAPETVYQLDAYGALKLAAERQGAPLCGNRVWVANDQVTAERAPAPRTTEQLVTVASGASEVVVFHGGRRIEVVEPPFTERQFVYDATTRRWTETSVLVDTLRGGTWLSMFQWSHGFDSLLVLGTIHSPSDVKVEVSVWDQYSNATHAIDTIIVPLTSTVDSTCIQMDPGRWDYFWVGPLETGHWDSTFVSNPVCERYGSTDTTRGVSLAGAFPPLGDEALVAVTRRVLAPTSIGSCAQCPWIEQPDQGAQQCRSITYESRPESTRVWAISLRTRQQRIAWDRSGQVFWLGLAESGGEVVLGEGTVRNTSILHATSSGSWVVESQSPILSACNVHYLYVSTGLATATPIPSDDVCRGGPGEGTIAPAPPVVSAGGAR